MSTPPELPVDAPLYLGGPGWVSEDLCPVCTGEGQVFIDGEPKFCLPCEGTGTRLGAE